MNELNRISWETFARTGDIEAYLLYRSTTKQESLEDKEEIWHKSEQEALS